MIIWLVVDLPLWKNMSSSAEIIIPIYILEK